MIQLPTQQLLQQSPDTAVAVRWHEFLDWDIMFPRLVRIALIIFVAVILYRLVRIVIHRILTREIEAEDPVVRRLREQRTRTLAGLLGNVALIGITAVTVMMILDVLLSNIAPILASFGILGLAFSFGAQSLVKDVITGTFMLMEGQFAVGDVIRVGDVSGTVERITLRTTILRDVEGVVHIIPNGEITRVSNMTKSWSRAVLQIAVSYHEDVDRVMDVLRDLLRTFSRDPEWGPLLIDEPEVPGVEGFAESAVIIRVMAKTLPQKQWDVARELRRRIKNRFDAEGIRIPFPHMTFYQGEGQSPAASGAPAGEH